MKQETLGPQDFADNISLEELQAKLVAEFPKEKPGLTVFREDGKIVSALLEFEPGSDVDAIRKAILEHSVAPEDTDEAKSERQNFDIPAKLKELEARITALEGKK